MLEREILKTSKRFGIRFVGPNCVGTVNTANGLYTPFIAFAGPFRRGKIGVFAQSGGVGLCLAERLCTSGLGISKLVSMGNKLDLDEADYLAYLMDDPETAVIYFYLEGFKRGRAFADLARRCSKPVILHKSNTSAMSLTIAQSHTAVLAADDQVVDSVCRESGILRVRSVSEAVTAAKGLCPPAAQREKSCRLITVRRTCRRSRRRLCKLRLSPSCPWSRTFSMKLKAAVAPASSGWEIRWTLGISSICPSISRVVEKVLRQRDIDGVVFIHVSHMVIEREATRRLVENLSALSRQSGKPVAIVMEIPFEERVLLEKNSDSPFFLEPAEAVQALAVRLKWGKTDAADRKARIRCDCHAQTLTIPLTIPR